MDSVLIDTSAIFALLNPDDEHHKKALVINESLTNRSITLLLPNFLLAESHTIINKRLGNQPALKFLNAALQDFEIERVTVEDEWTAHAILQETSARKNLSYFDAIAVAVAERSGIHEIFSFDRHFAVMGFQLSKP